MGALFIKANPQLAYPPAMEKRIWEWLDSVRPLPKNIRHPPRIKIALDLSGLPSHYPAEKMLTRMRALPIVLKPPSTQVGGVIPGASWTFQPFRARQITIHLGGSDEELRSSLRHELRHMVQSLLGDALGVDPEDPNAINVKAVGVPVPWVRGTQSLRWKTFPLTQIATKNSKSKSSTTRR